VTDVLLTAKRRLFAHYLKRISRQWAKADEDALSKAIAKHGDTAKTFAARLSISYCQLLRIMNGEQTHPPIAKAILAQLNHEGAYHYTMDELFSIQGHQEAVTS